MNIFSRILKFFDKLEDKIRYKLSHFPILYAFIGSIGIVLIWRGIWVMADNVNMPGWISLFLGIALTIITGLFVSFFIGDKIIISGLTKDKRIDEKTEAEIKEEATLLKEIEKDIKEIKEELAEE